MNKLTWIIIAVVVVVIIVGITLIYLPKGEKIVFTYESGATRIIKLNEPINEESLLQFARVAFNPETKVNFSNPIFDSDWNFWRIGFTCDDECVCGRYGGPEGQMMINVTNKTAEIGWSNRLITNCSTPIVGGCPGVQNIYLQECCNNWATGNNFSHVNCNLGKWTVLNNKCEWVCPDY